MSKYILIVEDDKILRETITQALELEGFTTDFAIDATGAIAKIREDSPDLVLLDLMLPGESGQNVLRKIKEDKSMPNVPVFVLTALESMSTIAESIKGGTKGYFIKSDYSLQQIVNAVKSELGL